MHIKQYDWLASEVIRVFEVLGFDQVYIESKRNDLVGKDRLEILRWCNNLDTQCKAALCERIDIPVENFNITIETLKRL